VVHLLEETLIRVGNPQYARSNRSYGLTTMRSRHLEVEGARLHFEFRGKSGKNHVVEVRDRRAARIVQACQELPGQELFQYLDEDGHRHCIDSGDVNEYLSATTGEPFTAKAFRTWGGSAAMVGALLELPPPQNKKELQKNLRAAMRETSQNLRNTVAVCRRHYVHPLIARHYEAGTFFDICQEPECRDEALNEDERALMALLQLEAAQRA
jgi:DNA topoisomerase-1